MQTIHPIAAGAQQAALDKLGAITMKAVKREPLSDDELQALRAAADHAGREAARVLGRQWDGETPAPGEAPDAFSWCELLTYVTEPF